MRRLVALAALFAPAVWCAPVTAAPPTAFPPMTFDFWSWFQVLLALMLVLGAIAGSAWLARRLGAGQHGAGGLRVIGGVAVGPKERVALVEVGDTWLLVGVAPGRVNALHVMPRQASAVEGGAEGVAPPPFAEWMKRAVQGRNPDK